MKYEEYKEFEIPGDEPLLNAKIHFNCDLNSLVNKGLIIASKGKDITIFFKSRKSNLPYCVIDDCIYDNIKSYYT